MSLQECEKKIGQLMTERGFTPNPKKVTVITWNLHSPGELETLTREVRDGRK